MHTNLSVLFLAKNNARLVAVNTLVEVITQNRSLGIVLSRHLEKLASSAEQSFAQDLVYGVARWYPRIEYFIDQLLTRPLKSKDVELKLLIAVGVYQLGFSRVPDYAAINETVKQVKVLKRVWAKALVNGVLREFGRQRATLQQSMLADDVARTAHPQWFIDQMKSDWPHDSEKILIANNQHPPMSLRVNCRHTSRAEFMQTLNETGLVAHEISELDYAIQLESPTQVSNIPGFLAGKVSVQDAAAQLAPRLLKLEPGQRVLDACAAPGGKTAAIVEQQAHLRELVALDIKASRVRLIHETLSRLGLNLNPASARTAQARLPAGSRLNILCANAVEVENWWDGECFDRILLDVPCSATGVIRRNPDIKLLRTESDLQQLQIIQKNLLNAIWQTLKPGGLLVYSTCSVLRVENERQLVRFLHAHADAKEIKIEANWGRLCEVGRQILPGESNMDGFYYACIAKRV